MSFVCKRRPGDVRMPAPLEVHLASELSVWITKTLCVLNRSLWVCQHYSTCCYVCFLSLVTATKAPPYQPAFARSQTFHSRHCPSEITTLSPAVLDPPRCHPFLDTTSRAHCVAWQAEEASPQAVHMLCFPWHAHSCHRRCLCESVCGNLPKPLL